LKEDYFENLLNIGSNNKIRQFFLRLSKNRRKTKTIFLKSFLHRTYKIYSPRSRTRPKKGKKSSKFIHFIFPL